MAKALIVDPGKCTTCRLCELVCAQRNQGSYRPARADIQVSINTADAIYFPMVCLQCEDAACIEACPTEALVRDPQTNAVLVVTENCDGCGSCEEACPYGAIRCFDGRAHKCELCGGDPECVLFCAPGALRYEEVESWPPAARQAYDQDLRELVQEVKS